MIGLRHFHNTDLTILREHVLKEYSDNEIFQIINEWNTKQYNNIYFEMLAVCVNNAVVGAISLYQHDTHTISIGPEIFPIFRRKGYASLAMREALNYAKVQGYTIATAQIRINNTASINLHEKLGFTKETKT